MWLKKFQNVGDLDKMILKFLFNVLLSNIYVSIMFLLTLDIKQNWVIIRTTLTNCATGAPKIGELYLGLT